MNNDLLIPHRVRRDNSHTPDAALVHRLAIS
jgi:hypothetical protein